MKKIFLRKLLIMALCVSMLPLCAFGAMDGELLTLPQPVKTRILWDDKSIEVNNINIHASCYVSGLAASELLGFYRRVLEENEWKMVDYFPSQNLMSFTKEDKFFYVTVLPIGPENNVYLIFSPSDLRVCRTLVDYFFKEEIAPDAEGKDMPDIPRFPNSRRRLNVFTQQEGYFELYETDAKHKEVGDFYRAMLKQYGWQPIRAFSPELLSSFKEARDILEQMTLLGFEKGEDKLLIAAYPMPRKISNSRTLIAITRNLGEELYPQEELEEGE